MALTNGGHALVLGGSIAGLLAARVLAEHYTSVTIVERDRLPSSADHRQGVPHGQHVHGMLPGGLEIIENLLPGFADQMTSAGALTGDILGNARWYLNGRPLRRAVTGLTALSASRPLIEATLRGRVRALPNVTVRDGLDITGLCTSAGGDRITGATVTDRADGKAWALSAGLVVDATGRGSRTPRWLADLGYAPPPSDRVGIDLAYTSCVFTAADEFFDGDIVIVTARFPGQRTSSVMQRLEGGRVLLTLAGVLGERPPSTLDGFAAYARTLATPDTAEMLRVAEPIGAPATFRFPTYERHRYELLDRFPAGLLVAGDAACAFNPVYGQGMAVAAMEAAALSEELHRGGEPDRVRYFAAVGRALEAPWRLAVGADLALPEVTGPSLPDSPLTGEYLGRLQLAATEDAELATALIRVMGLVDPPPMLLRPDVVERVMAAPVGTGG
ncbi:FAD-dependent oxidoreductase [Cryptosporangium minutisporangium]|uniref:FAD-binding monooxygenase n=1 Tax=Cryptosporangium minutisporangium TaxID=113569 RepID=A0ABP6SPU7_9ACTN